MLSVITVPAAADNHTGELTGTVSTEDGHLLEGADVSLVNVSTGDTETTTSDTNGSYTFGSIEPGDYRLEAEFRGGETVRDVTVGDDEVELDIELTPEESYFTVSVDGTNSPVTAGEEIDVDATVTNRGRDSGAQAVRLEIPEIGDDAEPVGPDGGSSRTVTLNLPTDIGDAGEYTAEVSTNDDTAEVEFVVDERETDMDVSISDTNSPVTEGETLTVEATLSNPGDTPASGTVTAGIDGVGSDTVRFSLGESEEATKSFEIQTEAGDAGEYTATVSVGDTTYSTEVTVEKQNGGTLGDTEDSSQTDGQSESGADGINDGGGGGADLKPSEGDEASGSPEQTQGTPEESQGGGGGGSQSLQVSLLQQILNLLREYIYYIIGVLGLVGAGYGGYRMVSSYNEEDEDTVGSHATRQSTDIQPNHSSGDNSDKNRYSERQETASSSSESPEIDEKIEEAEELVKKCKSEFEDNNLGPALGHANEAIEKSETVVQEAQGSTPDKVKQADDVLLNARQLRRQVREKKKNHGDIKGELDEAEGDLGRGRELLEEGEPEAALERVENLSERLDRLHKRAEKSGFDELSERANILEQRHDSIVTEAEAELQPETIVEPTEIPKAPDTSLTYDSIEKTELVGSGGNADVYRATSDTQNGKTTFALKEPRMSGTLHSEKAERMMKEAETWDKIDDHDHIVSVIDYDSEPLPWIAMEYMDAGDISDRAGELDINQALWTSLVTTKAVRHAHRRGIAHLDLKPENVLFRSTDENTWDVPKVADWGLSKHLLKHSKSIEGMSPHYAAPEQFDEEEFGKTDDITDVYQLGAVFYKLFTGKPPFEGKPTKVMRAVMDEEPTPPSGVVDVPEELDEILLTALAKRKENRFDDIVYLRDALRDLYEE